MSLKLYKLDPSAPCRAVYMIAEILDLHYETEEVNILVGEQLKPEYLEKNPLHQIPTLQDRDFYLADSHAIITYLVSKYGADKRGELYPSDLATRATIDQRLYFDATTVFPIVAQIVGEILGQKLHRPSEGKIAAANNAYAVLEKYLEKNSYAAADYLTLADVSLVASVSTLATLVPINDSFKRVQAWFNKLHDKEWYLKGNVRGLSAFAKLIENAIEQNKPKP